ncbi:hypothetical protein Cch01nite_43120 [Cellulomonas chitinilytica]|uniref:AB hydrolase-1 domain-containing protein n=1 Tax=Cellulomonas chitinilytica TaxID=398759 RepID=A0A919U1V6_9CELL|nr:alpha/beta fold hydrolase [Cellulomonas chitinilytica]GIG23588.1 hypothetical protein Cch01nite_43120 [Cellulomonas chitinilytica]
MLRTTSDRRPAHRAVAALALLAVTAGVLSACRDADSAPRATGEPSGSSGSSGSTLHMVENGDHRLAFYVTPGHGPTIVLDSGGGEDASYWADLVPQLHASTGATVITYDRAGLGRSDVVPGPWDVASAVSDLETGLQQLGVSQDVTLVSHSQAGEIATWFAGSHPTMLAGAVLVDANLPPFFTEEEVARLAAATQPEVDAAKEDPDDPRNRQLIATAESFVETSTAFHALAWPDTVPATVVVSERTPFEGSPEDAQRWRDAAASFVEAGPHRRLVTATGSSHDVPKDRPELVLEEIENVVAGRL